MFNIHGLLKSFLNFIYLGTLIGIVIAFFSMLFFSNYFHRNYSGFLPTSKTKDSPIISRSDCDVALDALGPNIIHFGCTFLSPDGKVGKIYYSQGKLPTGDVQKGFESQQIKFLEDLMRSRFFNRSGSIIFATRYFSKLPLDIEKKIYAMGTPLLSHSHDNKSDPYIIFQPDFHFIKTNGFRQLIEQLDKRVRKHPHTTRTAKVFWRGETSTPFNRQTHLRASSDICLNITRVKLCIMAKNHGWLNARVSDAVDSCQGYASILKAIGILGRPASQIEWARNKGVLDIAGHTNAYGLLWRLASGSVVFRVESKYTNAYIRRLRPWRHYIPIRSDLSDLINVTRLVKVRNFKYIRENARLLVSEFTYDREVDRVAKELSEFWRGTGKS